MKEGRETFTEAGEPIGSETNGNATEVTTEAAIVATSEEEAVSELTTEAAVVTSEDGQTTEGSQEDVTATEEYDDEDCEPMEEEER